MEFPSPPKPVTPKASSTPAAPPAAEQVTTPVNDSPANDSPRVSLPGEPVRQEDLVEGRLSMPPSPNLIVTQVFNFADEPTGIFFVGTNVETKDAGKIIIDHPDVAKIQYSVYKKRFGEYSIKEYGKSFGGKETSLNGTLLAKDQVLPLKDGDLISVGSYRASVSIKDAEVVKQPDDEEEPEDALTAKFPGSTNDSNVVAPAPSVNAMAPTEVATASSAPISSKPTTPVNNDLREMADMTKPCPLCAKESHISKANCEFCGADMKAKTGSAQPTPVNLPAEPPLPSSPPASPPATNVKVAGDVVVIPPLPVNDDTPTPKAKAAHPDAQKANEREVGVRKQDEKNKATTSGNGTSSPKPGTVTLQRNVDKGAKRNSFKAFAALVSAIGLVIVLIFVGKTCQEAGSPSTNVAAMTASSTSTTAAPVVPQVIEAPTPAPVAAPQPSCKPFDVALAKKYFGQDNLSDISLDSPTPGMKMHLGEGASMHCVKGKNGSACDTVRWDLSKPTAAQVCELL